MLGENVYLAWWTNKTGNDEVLFRASTDNGQTFEDKINLSNTTDAESGEVEIDSDTDSVLVTWWETNDTSHVPVMRVSNDNGETFGETIMLASNRNYRQRLAIFLLYYVTNNQQRIFGEPRELR
jgi:hypothetical protein